MQPAPQLRTLRPLLVALSTSAVLLGLWAGPLAAFVPRPVTRIAPSRDCIVPAGPDTPPLFCNRRLDDVDLLVVGDSRVSFDLRHEGLETAGSERVGLLWGPGAQLADLLPVVERSSARRVVLALSTMGFYAERQGPVVAISESPPPALAPGLSDAGLDRALATWVREQTERLCATGMPREQVEVQLLGWSDKYRADFLFDRLTTGKIDLALSQWVDLRRTLAWPVIEPRLWRKQWFQQADPHGVDRESRATFAPHTRERRLRNVSELAARVAALADTRAVLCVRLPMSPSSLQIEQEALPAEAFAEFCRAAGVPFVDYSGEAYTTYDGTHLTEFEARRMTDELAHDLRAGRRAVRPQ